MINAVERGMLAALIYLIDSIQGENDISLFNLLPGEQQTQEVADIEVKGLLWFLKSSNSSVFQGHCNILDIMLLNVNINIFWQIFFLALVFT